MQWHSQTEPSSHGLMRRHTGSMWLTAWNSTYVLNFLDFLRKEMLFVFVAKQDKTLSDPATNVAVFFHLETDMCIQGGLEKTSVSPTISIFKGFPLPFWAQGLMGTVLSFLPWGAVPLSSPVPAWRKANTAFLQKAVLNLTEGNGLEETPDLLKQNAHNQSDGWSTGQRSLCFFSDRNAYACCGISKTHSWYVITHTRVHTQYNLSRGEVDNVTVRGRIDWVPLDGFWSFSPVGVCMWVCAVWYWTWDSAEEKGKE